MGPELKRILTIKETGMLVNWTLSTLLTKVTHGLLLFFTLVRPFIKSCSSLLICYLLVFPGLVNIFGFCFAKNILQSGIALT